MSINMKNNKFLYICILSMFFSFVFSQKNNEKETYDNELKVLLGVKDQKEDKDKDNGQHKQNTSNEDSKENLEVKDMNNKIIIKDKSASARLNLAGKDTLSGKKDKPSNLSNVFVVNTINPGKTNYKVRPNYGTHKPVFQDKYKLKERARVKIGIYKDETVLIKRLAEEYQEPGEHIVYWDGLDERGVKVMGEFECRIEYFTKNRNEKIIKFEFEVK